MNSVVDLGREQLHELYYYMRLTRSLEERLERLFKQGKIVGGLYRSVGQEAESVGAAYALRDGDWFAPAIRNVGAMLVRGITPGEMLRQYMAKGSAPFHGKDNTTHFSDVGRGLIGPISPLGTMISVMAGVALGFKLKGEPHVALTFIGEGGTRTGAAHEGINVAAVRELPFVLIVEDNGWSFATRTSEETAVERLTDMAFAYGVPAEQVDGNDVLAVYEAARSAVARARAGGGMSLVAVETYRMKGHAQHDPQDYVPRGELEGWAARDPIRTYVDRLTGDGHATPEEIEAIDQRVESEMDRAVGEADPVPYPGPEEALMDVHAGGAGSPIWTRNL